MVGIGGHAVDEEIDVRFLALSLGLELHQIVLNAYNLAVHFHPHEALLHVDVQLFHHRASFAGDEGSQYRELGALRKVQHALHDVFRTVLLHQLSAHGRVGLADAGKEQSQVFIDFGGGTHSGTGIPARHFLLDGDGGRDALDEVTLRLAHASQELTGV